MTANVSAKHRRWLSTPGKGGVAHKDNSVRAVCIPPFDRDYFWNVEGYEGRWDLIDTAMVGDPPISI